MEGKYYLYEITFNIYQYKFVKLSKHETIICSCSKPFSFKYAKNTHASKVPLTCTKCGLKCKLTILSVYTAYKWRNIYINELELSKKLIVLQLLAIIFNLYSFLLK